MSPPAEIPSTSGLEYAAGSRHRWRKRTPMAAVEPEGPPPRKKLCPAKEILEREGDTDDEAASPPPRVAPKPVASSPVGQKIQQQRNGAAKSNGIRLQPITNGRSIRDCQPAKNAVHNLQQSNGPSLGKSSSVARPGWREPKTFRDTVSGQVEIPSHFRYRVDFEAPGDCMGGDTQSLTNLHEFSRRAKDEFDKCLDEPWKDIWKFIGSHAKCPVKSCSCVAWKFSKQYGKCECGHGLLTHSADLFESSPLVAVRCLRMAVDVRWLRYLWKTEPHPLVKSCLEVVIHALRRALAKKTELNVDLREILGKPPYEEPRLEVIFGEVKEPDVAGSSNPPKLLMDPDAESFFLAAGHWRMEVEQAPDTKTYLRWLALCYLPQYFPSLMCNGIVRTFGKPFLEHFYPLMDDFVRRHVQCESFKVHCKTGSIDDEEFFARAHRFVRNPPIKRATITYFPPANKDIVCRPLDPKEAAVKKRITKKTTSPVASNQPKKGLKISDPGLKRILDWVPTGPKRSESVIKQSTTSKSLQEPLKCSLFTHVDPEIQRIIYWVPTAPRLRKSRSAVMKPRAPLPTSQEEASRVGRVSKKKGVRVSVKGSRRCKKQASSGTEVTSTAATSRRGKEERNGLAVEPRRNNGNSDKTATVKKRSSSVPPSASCVNGPPPEVPVVKTNTDRSRRSQKPYSLKVQVKVEVVPIIPSSEAQEQVPLVENSVADIRKKFEASQNEVKSESRPLSLPPADGEVLQNVVPASLILVERVKRISAKVNENGKKPLRNGHLATSEKAALSRRFLAPVNGKNTSMIKNAVLKNGETLGRVRAVGNAVGVPTTLTTNSSVHSLAHASERSQICSSNRRKNGTRYHPIAEKVEIRKVCSPSEGEKNGQNPMIACKTETNPKPTRLMPKQEVEKIRCSLSEAQEKNDKPGNVVSKKKKSGKADRVSLKPAKTKKVTFSLKNGDKKKRKSKPRKLVLKREETKKRKIRKIDIKALDSGMKRILKWKPHPRLNGESSTKVVQERPNTKKPSRFSSKMMGRAKKNGLKSSKRPGGLRKIHSGGDPRTRMKGNAQFVTVMKRRSVPGRRVLVKKKNSLSVVTALKRKYRFGKSRAKRDLKQRPSQRKKGVKVSQIQSHRRSGFPVPFIQRWSRRELHELYVKLYQEYLLERKLDYEREPVFTILHHFEKLDEEYDRGVLKFKLLMGDVDNHRLLNRMFHGDSTGEEDLRRLPRRMQILASAGNLIRCQLRNMGIKYIADIVTDSAHETLVMLRNGRVVGVVVYSRFQPFGFIEIVFLAVDMQHHRKGYGAYLMNHLKDFLVKTGIRTMMTYADHTATKYFLKMGFQKEMNAEEFFFFTMLKHYTDSTPMVCRINRRILHSEWKVTNILLGKALDRIAENRNKWLKSLGPHSGADILKNLRRMVDIKKIPGLNRAKPNFVAEQLFLRRGLNVAKKKQSRGRKSRKKSAKIAVPGRHLEEIPDEGYNPRPAFRFRMFRKRAARRRWKPFRNMSWRVKVVKKAVATLNEVAEKRKKASRSGFCLDVNKSLLPNRRRYPIKYPKIPPNLSGFLEEVLQTLKVHPSSKPFIRIGSKKLPKDSTCRPLDLETISKRMALGYYRHIYPFMVDVRRLLIASRAFNKNCARSLEKVYLAKMEQLFGFVPAID